jgi:hypothetical protein
MSIQQNDTSKECRPNDDAKYTDRPQHGPISNNPYFDNEGPAAATQRSLPPILVHLKSTKSLKELFKCSLAVWIMTLFIVINPVLKAEGQALFFGW